MRGSPIRQAKVLGIKQIVEGCNGLGVAAAR
jgi:hypothetical protein